MTFQFLGGAVEIFEPLWLNSNDRGCIPSSRLLHVHGLRRATYVRNLDSDQGLFVPSQGRPGYAIQTSLSDNLGGWRRRRRNGPQRGNGCLRRLMSCSTATVCIPPGSTPSSKKPAWQRVRCTTYSAGRTNSSPRIFEGAWTHGVSA